jgi:hypothetical protein
MLIQPPIMEQVTHRRTLRKLGIGLIAGLISLSASQFCAATKPTRPLRAGAVSTTSTSENNTASRTPITES